MSEGKSEVNAEEKLNQDEKKLLLNMSDLEELFKNRYTDDDTEYMQLKQKPLPPPPIINPWDVKSFRNRSYDRRQDRGYRRGNYRDQHRSSNWGDYSRRRDYRDRDDSSDRQRYRHAYSSEDGR